MTQTKSLRQRSYSDFSLDDVQAAFQLTLVPVVLFPQIQRVEPDAWLQDTMHEGFDISTVSEKARSEFIVAPILLYLRKIHEGKISIYSGVNFTVDATKGLRGACDFIISLSPMLPTLQAPLLVAVEAKKNDIEEGIGQCIAEMVAAQIFNQRRGNEIPAIYGCVTTGENWQFLRLTGTNLEIDKNRYFLVNLSEILGILNMIVSEQAALLDPQQPV